MFNDGLTRYWLELLLGAGILIGSLIYHQKVTAASPKTHMHPVPSLSATVPLNANLRPAPDGSALSRDHWVITASLRHLYSRADANPRLVAKRPRCDLEVGLIMSQSGPHFSWSVSDML